MKRRPAQTGKVAGASPATRTIFWNANRTSEPGLGANESVPSGMWRKPTAFRQPLQEATNARVVQREPLPYKQVALDKISAELRSLPDARTNFAPAAQSRERTRRFATERRVMLQISRRKLILA